MVNWIDAIWVRRLATLLLVVSGLFYALSQTSYWLYGDSANFMIDANLLRRGYFTDNLEAHRMASQGLAAPHIRLVTEGGFPFLLYVSRHLNPHLPFLLNAFIAPLFLGAMAWLLYLTDPKRGPPIVFLLFLMLLVLQPNIRVQFQRYCFPYRDMPAHTLALLSLCFAICAYHTCQNSPQKDGHKIRWLLLSGFTLGLGMWFRVPVFLFIPTAGWILFLIIRAQERPAEKMKLVAAMAVGGLLGLSPLFAQNLFEGKAFYQSGQMNIMVSSDSLALGKPAAATVSLSNASFNAWPQLRLAFIITPLPIWLLIAGGLVHGFMKQRLRTAILFSVALTFYLFYACYIKPVDRYIWMVNFMLLPLAVTWLDGFLHRFKSFLVPGLTLVTCGVLVACGIRTGEFDQNRHQARDARHFSEWINQQLPDPTVVVTPSHALRAWVSNYADPQIDVLKRWSLHERDVERKIYELPFAFKRGAYDLALLGFGGEDEQRLPSVWRTDILNEYDLQALPERRPLKYSPFSWLELERLHSRTRTAETITLTKTAAKTVYVTANAYETPTLPVTLSHQQSVLAESVLFSGPNIFTIANPGSSTIALTSTDPLPAMESLRTGKHPTLRKDYLGYGNVMSVSNFVHNINFIIYGYADWTRDWGHHERFAYTPVVRAKHESAFRVPPQPERVSFRAYYTVRTPIDQDPPADPHQALRPVRYVYGDNILEPTTWFIGPPYRYNRRFYCDVIHDVYIAENKGAGTPAVLSCADLPPGYDMLLLRSEYQLRTPSYAPIHAHGSKLLIPRSGQRWSIGIPKYFPRFDELEKLEPVSGFE